MADITFIGTQPQWWEHLAPLANTVKAHGVFEVCWTFPPSNPVAPRDVLRDAYKRGPVVAASWVDAMTAHQAGARNIVLMEHGAGQSYSSRHRSYPGGQDRTKLALVLAPNEQAAERHRKFYRGGPPVEVVGCPKLDFIDGLDPKPCGYPPVVAFSTHWDCRVSPEAGSAWSHNRHPLVGPAMFDELVRMRDLGMIQLIAHAHPRIADEVRPACTEREVAFVESFDKVVSLADLYMVDNSSTLFEFAALDRPVIVVDSPRYRPRVDHGLRFWTHADVGVRISKPSEVARAVMLALEDPLEVAEQRRRLVADVYPHIGRSRMAALDAIAARFGS